MKIKKILENSYSELKDSVCYRVSKQEHTNKVLIEVSNELFGGSLKPAVKLDGKYNDLAVEIDAIVNLWLSKVSLQDKIGSWNEFREYDYLIIYDNKSVSGLPSASELAKDDVSIIDWVWNNTRGYYSLFDDYAFYNNEYLMSLAEEDLFLSNREFMTKLLHHLINNGKFAEFFHFDEDVEFDYEGGDEEYVNGIMEEAESRIKSYYGCEELVEPLMHIQSEINKRR